ncbi:hypothetical protein H6F67_16940 [Microcoleus sp. FACHB-1515]|uniref:hypothetical protein n=1 Tax=Cyanophyceae TaxID=3028117 RepID=UPI001687FE63|nr:hypothetical protein [Microcoleus sp. FACHB-1515]MBD2091531.1 hypothetical protein [Microcoleus sp. FACHB-1515]
MSASLASASLKTCIWLMSIAVWMFGLIERTVGVLTEEHLTLLKLAQVLMMAIGLLSLFILKPKMPTFSDEGSMS